MSDQDIEAPIPCPTCDGEGDDVSDIYPGDICRSFICQDCQGTGQVNNPAEYDRTEWEMKKWD